MVALAYEPSVAAATVADESVKQSLQTISTEEGAHTACVSIKLPR